MSKQVRMVRAVLLKWCEGRLRQLLSEELLPAEKLYETLTTAKTHVVYFNMCLVDLNRVCISQQSRIPVQTRWIHPILQEMSCDLSFGASTAATAKGCMQHASQWWDDLFKRTLKLVRWISLSASSPTGIPDSATRCHLGMQVCCELAALMRSVSTRQRRQAALNHRCSARARLAASRVAL